MNIIGDIAARYDELILLLDKMPPGQPVSVGDMVDRGNKSKEVINFFMNNGLAVLGNHEHMLLDYYNEERYYESGTWKYNGGQKTINSFNGVVPDSVINWIKNLPKYLIFDDYLISHSFVHPSLSVELACDFGSTAYSYQGDNSIIWSREEPIKRPEYKLQIAGHNSQFGLRWFEDFAVCIDTSRQKVLTGIHLPSMKIYQQPYLENK